MSIAARSRRLIRPSAYFLGSFLAIALALVLMAAKAAEASGNSSFQGSEQDKATADVNCPIPLPNPETKEISGVVDFEFTVQTDGSVTDPKILCETPEGYGLAGKVLRILPEWRFSPKVADGKPVADRMRYRINFRLPETKNPR